MSITSNAVTILKRRYYVHNTYVFKIRRRSDGLFSSGGTTPKFSTKGKAWATLGLLMQHLGMFLDYAHYRATATYKLPEIYKDCDIVFFEMKEAKTIDVSKHLQEYTGREVK